MTMISRTSILLLVTPLTLTACPVRDSDDNETSGPTETTDPTETTTPTETT